MNSRNYVLVADSHIRTDSAEDFFAMLEQIFQYRPAGVVFLGDVFELWIALDGYESAIHYRFLDWCRKARRQFEVGFILGNHEFYLREKYEDAFSWIENVSHTAPCGVHFLHGDLINRADTGYLLLRKLLRNGITRLLLKTTAGTIGPKVSDYVLNSLKPTNQHHKRQLPVKFLEEYAEAAAERNIARIFTGHFHRHETLVFPKGVRTEILPAWETAQEIVLLKPDLQSLCGHWRNLLSEKKE